MAARLMRISRLGFGSYKGLYTTDTGATVSIYKHVNEP